MFELFIVSSQEGFQTELKSEQTPSLACVEICVNVRACVCACVKRVPMGMLTKIPYLLRSFPHAGKTEDGQLFMASV